MAARSTGLFTREGFNLDAEMQVPENSGGSVELLGDLSKAKTIRIILINPVITGDAVIRIDFDTGNLRFKARERYSFGFSDWRGFFGSQGA